MTSKNATFVDIQGKPSLLDVPLYPFSRPETNALIIFPYKIENDNADLYTPSEMRKIFPLTWKYLKAHKTKLIDRSIQGGTATTW